MNLSDRSDSRIDDGMHAGHRAVRRLLAVLFAALLVLGAVAPAAAQAGGDPAPLRFESSTEEARFRMLVAELRCVMCQNQSLADSNAQIAMDLRREVLALMREGRSDTEIRDHLVARYGEFVLYRPRLHGANWLLWLGPLVFLLAGAVAVGLILRRNRGQAATVPPVGDDSEQEW